MSKEKLDQKKEPGVTPGSVAVAHEIDRAENPAVKAYARLFAEAPRLVGKRYRDKVTDLTLSSKTSPEVGSVAWVEIVGEDEFVIDYMGMGPNPHGRWSGLTAGQNHEDRYHIGPDGVTVEVREVKVIDGKRDTVDSSREVAGKELERLAVELERFLTPDDVSFSFKKAA